MEETVVIFKMPKDKVKSINKISKSMDLSPDLLMSLLVDLAIIVFEDEQR